VRLWTRLPSGLGWLSDEGSWSCTARKSDLYVGWTTCDGAGCSNIGDEELVDAGHRLADNTGTSRTEDLDAGTLVRESDGDSIPLENYRDKRSSRVLLGSWNGSGETGMPCGNNSRSVLTAIETRDTRCDNNRGVTWVPGTPKSRTSPNALNESGRTVERFLGH